MRTSIQVSQKVKQRLARFKAHPRETYEDVIQRTLDIIEEEDLEFNETFQREIEQARRQVRSGKHLTTEELVRDLGL